jgi:hypothetical protein
LREIVLSLLEIMIEPTTTHKTIAPTNKHILLGNNRVEEEKYTTITTQEYNVETPKPEKKPRPLSKSTRELLLCENFYNT